MTKTDNSTIKNLKNFVLLSIYRSTVCITTFSIFYYPSYSKFLAQKALTFYLNFNPNEKNEKTKKDVKKYIKTSGGRYSGFTSYLTGRLISATVFNIFFCNLLKNDSCFEQRHLIFAPLVVLGYFAGYPLFLNSNAKAIR
jgi:hypothetical protein